MKHVRMGAIALSLVVLTACGGGGGGGQTTMRPDPNMPDPPPTIQDTQNAFGQGGNQPTFNPLDSESAIRGQVRQGAPAFGSVAMNLYTPGLASVRRVDTTFTGDRFTLSMRRQNGTGFTLDTNRHYVDVVADSTTTTNPVTNRPFASGYLMSVSGQQATIAGATVEWSNPDYTDYMAAGYWVQVDAQANAMDMGAFIDGRDYSLEVAPSLPPQGTATYRGAAGGVYVAGWGTDSFSPGAVGIGEYGGRARLTADFGTMQIEGRVDQIQTNIGYGQHANGVAFEQPYYEATNIEMIFRPVSITQAGLFHGNNVEFISRDPQMQLTSSSGAWAGQFSNVEDAHGNPRAVAGTNTGYLETVGGSRAFLTGAFYGATARFE